MDRPHPAAQPEPVAQPEPAERQAHRPSVGHWFEAVAAHMGSAYLRYSFTKGTEQEVDTLVEMLALKPGMRVLDVGCGPGRHSLALARRGIDVVGVDISADFVAIASSAAADEGLSARFQLADARRLTFEGEFDAAISLCQGAFGLAGGPGAEDGLPARELDEAILDGIGRALGPGGVTAVSAFSAYFMLRFLEDHDEFDAQTGVNREDTVVKNAEGAEISTQLWTTCFTPRELRLLARTVGLVPVAVYGVTPGDYAERPPSLDVPEFLLLASQPG
jgi:SAM-dependent methyltransferase